MHAMNCIIKSYSHCKCSEGQGKELLMGATYKVGETASCLAHTGEVSTVQVSWWSHVEWPTTSSTGALLHQQYAGRLQSGSQGMGWRRWHDGPDGIRSLIFQVASLGQSAMCRLVEVGGRRAESCTPRERCEKYPYSLNKCHELLTSTVSSRAKCNSLFFLITEINRIWH